MIINVQKLIFVFTECHGYCVWICLRICLKPSDLMISDLMPSDLIPSDLRPSDLMSSDLMLCDLMLCGQRLSDQMSCFGHRMLLSPGQLEEE